MQLALIGSFVGNLSLDVINSMSYLDGIFNPRGGSSVQDWYISIEVSATTMLAALIL